MLKPIVENLLNKALSQRKDLFLIDLLVLDDNQIKVVIDGDNGISVEDCVFVSRAIEHNLDREELDFSLEVTSAGATAPLEHKRQYKKNLGRILSVKTPTDNFEGTLTEANENEIILEWKTREPKPIGKGKVTVKKQVKIPYNSIVETKVMIKF
ncbi:MAG TPA: ribosome assembly cofactor RimP [Flavobacteriaceae bacterium]|nr:ribosome assembly cofactor RimP [Flavobacteriaceae bacterium]